MKHRLRLLAALLLALIAAPAAAQQCGTLTTCPNASTPLSGTELLYIVQNGVSAKMTTGTLASTILSGIKVPSPTLYGNISGTTGSLTPITLGSGVASLLTVTATGAGSFVGSSSPTISGPTVTGSFTATGLVTVADLANPSTTINGTVCTLGANCTISTTSSAITPGTTNVTGGTSGDIEFNNAGVLGEKGVVGSGSVVLATAPSVSALTVTGSLTATGLVTNADLVNAATTVNGTVCTLGATCSVTATAASLTPGTTTVLSGTSGDIEFNNAGVLGEKGVTGSGSVVLATAPSVSALTVTGSLTATGLVTNADLVSPSVTVNGTACTLGASCTVSTAGVSVVLGTTTIAGGASGNIEFNNGGVFGEKGVTGTGSVVLAASPTITGTLSVTGGVTATGALSATSASVMASGGATLRVGDTANTAGSLTVTNSGGATYFESYLTPTAGSAAPIYFTSEFASNIWMTLGATGKLGIGTTTPGALLEVNGPAKIDGGAMISGQFIDVRQQGALCNGTTDDTAAINNALLSGVGYAVIPTGYVCAFSGPINLQYHATLKIMPGATLKFLGTSGDEILGVGGNTIDDRQNIEGPGTIDATNHTGGGNIIHYEGGSYDVIRDITIHSNSATLVALQINGNQSLPGGTGLWSSGLVDRFNVQGEIGDVIDLVGTSVAGPTNNAFYNVTAFQPVMGHCVYAPRDNDTEYFYNLNCNESGGVSGITIGAATGFSQAITSGSYVSSTGVVTLTLTNAAAEMQVGDTVTLAGLTGTGALSSLESPWTWSVSTVSGHTVTFTGNAGLGTVTITGGNLAVTDTDAWGYHFDNYILSGGTYGVQLYETHDDSFSGGDDAQGQTNPGIINFSGPSQGPMSIPARYVACHTMISDNIGYMCASVLPYTVATLPIPSAGVVALDTNTRVYVTDAATCARHAAPTGGGSTFCPVVWNGSAWIAE